MTSREALFLKQENKSFIGFKNRHLGHSFLPLDRSVTLYVKIVDITGNLCIFSVTAMDIRFFFVLVNF